MIAPAPFLPTETSDGSRLSLLANVAHGSRVSWPVSTSVAVPLNRQSTLISQHQPIPAASAAPYQVPVSHMPGTIPNSLAVPQQFASSSISPWLTPAASYPNMQLPPVQTSLPYPSYGNNSSNVSFLHGGPLFPQQPPPAAFGSQLRSYKRRDPPKFSGDILKFPAWFHEWRYVIAPSRM